MNHVLVVDALDEALKRSMEHLSGSRDQTLPSYFDPQVERFSHTLREMKASINTSPFERVSHDYMRHAIADGWPFSSALGNLILKAEDLYDAM